MKAWRRAQSNQPSVELYKDERPHRSPARCTPAVAYTTRPKATLAERPDDTHYRVRRDRVDKTGSVTLRHDGRIHHIAIGRTFARTPIILLGADLDIHVIDAATGELYRHLTLDPTHDYQPTGRLPGTPKTATTRPPMKVRAVRDVLRHHTAHSAPPAPPAVSHRQCPPRQCPPRQCPPRQDSNLRHTV
jgi:hypothetical protein